MKLLFILCFLLCTSSALKPPLVYDYEVIDVKNVEEIERLLKKKHEKPDKQAVFHIASSGTFLSRRDPIHWQVEESVKDLAKESSPIGDKKLSKLLRSRLLKGLKNILKHPPIPYVEFYFSNFTVKKSKSLIPVSPCHSELLGEGSVVKLQMTDIDRATPHGTIGIPKLLQGVLSGGEAEFETEDENLSTFSLKCTIPHGQMGQIFLSDTVFLYYKLWYRTLIYDQQKGIFKVSSEFKEKGTERSIIKGGMGEWFCATSSMIQLQCFNTVRDITIPEGPLNTVMPTPIKMPNKLRHSSNNYTLPITNPIPPASSPPGSAPLRSPIDKENLSKANQSSTNPKHSFMNSQIKNMKEYLELKKLKQYRPIKPKRQN